MNCKPRGPTLRPMMYERYRPVVGTVPFATGPDAVRYRGDDKLLICMHTAEIVTDLHAAAGNSRSTRRRQALAFRSCQLVDDGRPVTMHLWLLMRAGLRGGGPYLQ